MKQPSKKEQIQSLIKTGHYKIDSPNVINKIKADFYAPGSKTTLPEDLIINEKFQRLVKKESSASMPKKSIKVQLMKKLQIKPKKTYNEKKSEAKVSKMMEKNALFKKLKKR